MVHGNINGKEAAGGLPQVPIWFGAIFFASERDPPVPARV